VWGVFRVLGLGFRVSGFECGVIWCVFWVLTFGVWVSGVRFWILRLSFVSSV